jgi:glycosyltransferase involved in cell wall biosynthesis
MKIGVYFTPAKAQGGVFQYSITLLEALSEIPGHKYTILTVSTDIPENIRKNRRFEVVDMVTEIYKKALELRTTLSYFIDHIAPGIINLLYRAKIFSVLTPIYRITQKKYINVIESRKLDLMFYPTSSNLSFLCDTPSVVAIHDVMHRVRPEFKEVSAGGRWENREYGFQNISKKAFRILVDSEVGKQNVVKYYRTGTKKVIVLPFLPPSYLDSKMSESQARRVCDKLKLPGKFIFYPAKFWPHKNHRNLIKALNILKKQGVKINLVLTGSKEADFSTYNEVFDLILRYKLKSQIYYLGYVSDKEISAIYKTAEAMVMPTFFGPTNIPILEAWVMGTPAITSDIRGCRNQLGDAGLLINPQNPSDIAEKIRKVYNNKNLRKELSLRGKRRLKLWTFRRLTQRISEIIKDFENKDYVSEDN